MSSQTLPETSPPIRPPENAPSQTAADEPSWARTLGLAGMMLTVIGLIVVTFNDLYGPRFFGKGWGFVFLALGISGMLFHAVRDRDVQIRRAYAFVGYGLLGLMLVLVLVNTRNFISYGWACTLISLCFLLSCARHETDAGWQRRILATLGLVGASMTAIAFIGGIVTEGFLQTYGLMLAILGLAYLCAFINQSDPLTDVGYRTGLALGGIGAFAILYTILRSAVPPLMKMETTPFLVPTGLLLLLLGAIYVAVALGIVSDNKLVVLTRRELASYFHSPVAYIVMLAMALLGALSYDFFINALTGGALYEPIIYYYYQVIPLFVVVIFVVPSITMRLLAEEKRTGTYEVLMCAPVKESTVVFSKFLAGLTFYMLLWVIWALYLIALRVENGKEFDYRPLLSYYLALLMSGAGFIAMGLFFSSLSKNQIIGAVLTFIGMLVLLLIGRLQGSKAVSALWQAVFRHLSYTDTWDAALLGQLHLREMILQGSFAFFWLFLTVKVLEARRWS
ncbi:MAG: ABC transporter permease [Planctomycetes bacterium]|nr:ABC transporter permease [Planctomycetota bacterium]